MQSDSFTEFLTQSGVLNLILAIAALGVVWLVLFIWALRRENERRRRRKAGEPPLPNFLTQFINLIQGLSANAAGTTNRSAMYSSSQETEMPLPSMDDLTNDLPEPDFDDLGAPSSTEPPATNTPSRPRFADVPEPAAPPPTPPDADSIPAMASNAQQVGAEPERSTAFAYSPGSSQLPTDAVEVMRVWRDVSDGALIFQMGDHVFQTLPEMHDNGFSKRFIKIVEDMTRVAHAGALAAGLQPPDFQRSSAIISQQGDWARRQQTPATPHLEPTLEPQLTPSTPASNTGSIADQIEDLLQRRLSQIPAFQKRSIHVRSNIDGTLRIEVDGRSYPHVDEVIDPNVREFIQNVIREWEARQ